MCVCGGRRCTCCVYFVIVLYFNLILDMQYTNNQFSRWISARTEAHEHGIQHASIIISLFCCFFLRFFNSFNEHFHIDLVVDFALFFPWLLLLVHGSDDGVAPFYGFAENMQFEIHSWSIMYQQVWNQLNRFQFDFIRQKKKEFYCADWIGRNVGNSDSPRRKLHFFGITTCA